MSNSDTPVNDTPKDLTEDPKDATEDIVEGASVDTSVETSAEPEQADPPEQVDPFAGVAAPLAKALAKKGYAKLTPVQKAVLDPELADADALVSAQTGSGKTVAFGIALAPTLLEGQDHFKRADAPFALIITPTRELALQVMRELEWLYGDTGARTATCVGGMDMRSERRALERGAHIVVGTPGRLRDHIERGSLNISALRAVVLDEADEMLDLGFRDDLEYMLDTTPKERRTLMFSATVPRSIAMLAKRYQRDAVRITTKAEEKQHSDIEYRALTVAPNDKENAIINLVRYYEPKNAIVFCATRATVNHMTSRFSNRGFSVVALSGELSQNLRSHAIQALRDGRAQICIATDVAARGIDLPDLELVVHADIPKSREPLLHRSGRTGRAGRKGVSALIVPYNWRKRTERLLESARVEATWAKPPSVEEILQRDRERFLANPTLTEPVKEEEQAFVKELIEQHGAEQIAAALIRTQSAGRPAPEELLDRPERPARERDRDRNRRDRDGDDGYEYGNGGRRNNAPGTRKERVDFEDGVWISMTVGRKHTADPKWLLPMVCRAGCITKKDIGAIRIHMAETHVELTPKGAEKFFETLGGSNRIEKTITVKRLEGIPDLPEDTLDEDGPGYHRKPRTMNRSEGRKGESKKHKQKPFRDNFNRSDRSKEYSRRAAEEKDAKGRDHAKKDYSSKTKGKFKAKFGADGKFQEPQDGKGKKPWFDDSSETGRSENAGNKRGKADKKPFGKKTFGKKPFRENAQKSKSGAKPFKGRGGKAASDKTGASTLKRKKGQKKD
ncbi:DEAD/DEAH box helicase [Kiloniella litopenaei]|uniref:DEAD/DEAH box helicase n=1 Tax=Kiloniella litopenaei TaxID=1549748 RepID=UPI0009E5CDCA|nr:DEAD/DEAH box helicase [Kiloniella litopenaei]